MSDKPTRLRKELGLFDVYAISTGAMFSVAELATAMPRARGIHGVAEEAGSDRWS